MNSKGDLSITDVILLFYLFIMILVFVNIAEKNIIKEIKKQNEISETRKTIQKRSTNYLINLYEGE